MKIFIYILFLLLPGFVYGQLGQGVTGGATHLSIARAGTTLMGIAAAYSNPAGLATMTGMAIDLSADRRFDLKDLTTVSAAIGTHSAYGNFAVSFTKFGFESYSEQKLGLAYARKLNERLYLGAQFDMLTFSIEEFVNENKFTFELGVYTIISKQFHLGAHIFSPGSVGLNEDNEIPSRMRIGGKYLPSDKVTFYTEIDKAIDRDVEAKVGIDYAVGERLNIRLGFNPVLSAFYFGFGLNISEQLNLMGAFSINNTLGNSPGISLRYSPK